MSFTSSLMANPWASPFAVFRKVSTTSRAWSEWDAVPAAIFRAKFLATTVSIVAPQTPVRFLSSPFFDRGILHGPMAHILQQLSSTPMGQGFKSSALVKAVEMFSFSALSIISRVALSTLRIFCSDMVPPY